MKISIVTVTFNSERTLKDTLDSVFCQTYPDIEYIVVDGESNDSTIDILQEYEKRFAGRMRFVSESDKGIYDESSYERSKQNKETSSRTREFYEGYFS